MTGNLPSCKVIPQPTWALDYIQSFRPQPDGVLLSPLGWCSCLPPFSASRCGNQGISEHWYLPWWGCLSASHSLTAGRSVVFLSSTFSSLVSPPPPAVSAICPHHISAGRSRSANNPLLVKLPKSRITAHLHSFIPLFPTFGTNSLTLFNPILPSRPSKQLFTTTSYHPPSKSSIVSTPINPTQTHPLRIACFPSRKSL